MPSTPLFKVLQQVTHIEYGSAEVVDKMKLVDDKVTRYPSQLFTKQMQEQFLPLCIAFVLGEAEILKWIPPLSWNQHFAMVSPTELK